MCSGGLTSSRSSHAFNLRACVHSAVLHRTGVPAFRIIGAAVEGTVLSAAQFEFSAAEGTDRSLGALFDRIDMLCLLLRSDICQRLEKSSHSIDLRRCIGCCSFFQIPAQQTQQIFAAHNFT
jgi:hypothetical protein